MAHASRCGTAFRSRKALNTASSLFYPYDNELHVRTRDGRLILKSDWGDPPDSGVRWPPFRNFGDPFYTYQLLLDFKVEKGMAIRTEPHPRFYTDPSDTV